jgi:hypothetical protein
MAEVIDFPGTPSAEAEPEAVAASGPAEAIKGDHQRQSIVPEQWQRHNIRSTVRYLAGLHWHRARFQGLRSPLCATKTALYAMRGVVRLTVRVAKWAYWTDGWKLESMAVAAGRAGHLGGFLVRCKLAASGKVARLAVELRQNRFPALIEHVFQYHQWSG